MRLRHALLVSALLLTAAFLGAALAQFDPSKAYRESEAAAVRYPDPPVSYATPAFVADRTDFTSHDEVMTFIERLRSRAAKMTVRFAACQMGVDFFR